MTRPAVVAHRGASDDAPEHTLSAYRKAIEDGADAVECDVRLTRDGVLVCVHDRRVNRTSDGRGVVSTLELADLSELDFSSWRRRQRRVPGWYSGQAGPAFAEEPDWDASSVLTLERLLELVSDASRPVQLAIETKHPTRYAGLVEQTLCALLRRFPLFGPGDGRDGAEGGRVGPGPSRVRVMSFSPVSLRRVHALAPEVPTVLLLRRLQLRLREGQLPVGVPIAGPYLGLVRRHPWLVQRLHDAGHEVHVWTVDAPADVELVAALGVDAVITNRPRRVRQQLEARPCSSAREARP